MKLGAFISHQTMFTFALVQNSQFSDLSGLSQWVWSDRSLYENVYSHRCGPLELAGNLSWNLMEVCSHKHWSDLNPSNHPNILKMVMLWLCLQPIICCDQWEQWSRAGTRMETLEWLSNMQSFCVTLYGTLQLFKTGGQSTSRLISYIYFDLKSMSIAHLIIEIWPILWFPAIENDSFVSLSAFL